MKDLRNFWLLEKRYFIKEPWNGYCEKNFYHTMYGFTICDIYIYIYIYIYIHFIMLYSEKSFFKNRSGHVQLRFVMQRWLTLIVIPRHRLHLRASVRYLVCKMIITDSVIAMIRVLSLGARWNYCASWISASYRCHDIEAALQR